MPGSSDTESEDSRLPHWSAGVTYDEDAVAADKECERYLGQGRGAKQPLLQKYISNSHIGLDVERSNFRHLFKKPGDPTDDDDDVPVSIVKFNLTCYTLPQTSHILI